MAQVTVTKNEDGEWVIHFPISDEDFIVLPADSTRTEPEEGIVRYGTAETYLEVNEEPMLSFSYTSPDMPVSYVMEKTSRGRDTSIGQRRDAFDQLEIAWQEAVDVEEDPEEEEAPAEPEDPSADVPKGGRKKKKSLRLKKKTRRTKRNARNRKQRKSHKLSTRRR